MHSEYILPTSFIFFYSFIDRQVCVLSTYLLVIKTQHQVTVAALWLRRHWIWPSAHPWCNQRSQNQGASTPLGWTRYSRSWDWAV